MNKFVLAINSKGQQRTFSERTWHLMRSMKEQGTTRKGWTFLKELTEGEARDFERSLGKKSMEPARPATGIPATPKATFIPKEIEEHAKKKAEEAAAGSGEKVTTAEALQQEGLPVQAAEPAKPAPTPAQASTPAKEEPSKPAQGAEAAAGAAAEADDFTKLPNIGAKSIEALTAAGITTYAGLRDAGSEKVEGILTAAGLGAKTPVVKKWMAFVEQTTAQA